MKLARVDRDEAVHDGEDRRHQNRSLLPGFRERFHPTIHARTTFRIGGRACRDGEALGIMEKL